MDNLMDYRWTCYIFWTQPTCDWFPL